MKLISTGDICMETFPCQHDCIFVNEDGIQIEKRMFGNKIYEIMKNMTPEEAKKVEGMSFIYHFKDYENFKMPE